MSHLRSFFFVIVASAFFILCVGAENKSPQNEHPRLFFTQQDLARLREEAQTTHRDLWLPIRQFVDEDTSLRALPANAPISDDLDVYRSYGDALIPLAFVCLVDQQVDDCDMARRYLLTITAWDRWDRGSEYDLGFGHILFGSAIAFDWLYDEFTPEERSELIHRIGQRAQAMFDASTQDYNATWNNWWATSFVQNHYWVNNAALGMAGLVLGNEIDPLACSVAPEGIVNLRTDPDIDAVVSLKSIGDETFRVIGQQTGSDGLIWWHLEDNLWVREDVVTEQGDCQTTSFVQPEMWVEQATNTYRRVNAFLEGIGDGTWHEGIFYQDYGLAMALPFLVNLRRLNGTDLLPSTYLNNYVQWRLYNLLPGTPQYLMAYGDLEWWWHDIRASGILRFIAAEYDDPTSEWVAQQLIQYEGRTAEIWRVPWYVFEFLYYDPGIQTAAPASDQPLARTFPDLEGVIWRTGWSDDALVFGLKTGAYGGRFSYETFTRQQSPWDLPCASTHCALNEGHDHNDANGFYLFANGKWLAPEVQGENNRPTAFHNTILIDGQGQQRPREETPEAFKATDGILEQVADMTLIDYLAADATHRYGQIEDLISNTRYVAFVRPDYFLMVDHVAANGPHQYEWTTHFGDHAILQENWVRGDSGSQVLGVQVVSPASFASTLGDDGSPFVRIRPSQPVESVNFVHLLVPTTFSNWETRPTAELSVDTGEALFVHVTRHDGSERSEDALFVYATQDQPWGGQIGPYYFDGRFALIQWGSAGEIRSLSLVGGTMLSSFGDGVGKGQILVANIDPAAQFEAVFNKTQVDVFTNSQRSVMLYAPLAQQLSVNGMAVPLERKGEFVVVPGQAGV